MIALRRGVSRTVLLVGPWALKVPSWRHGPKYWLFGLLGNVLEAERWLQSHHPRLARVRCCAPLGLLLVMDRARGPIIGRRMTREERALFPFFDTAGQPAVDDNGHNVTIEPDGSLLLVDYGDPDVFLIVEPQP